MPAKHLSRINEDGVYLHIYNKGVENRAIFNSEEDYKVFLGFIEEYLLSPKDPKSLKKEFKVKGKTFKGIPHQPKNYFNQVELVAYSLLPNHFHLLVRQLSEGVVEKFVRSLCTRYSIFFNKKYQHYGILFAGPYKSVSVKAGSALLQLTRFFHYGGSLSSYPEYLGKRQTEWIKPEGVPVNYKELVEGFQLNNALILEKIILEDGSSHLERSNLTSIEITNTNKEFKQHPRLAEFLAVSFVVFLLLMALGLRNIATYAQKNHKPLPSANSGVLSETKKAIPETIPMDTVTVEAEDNSLVNIRKEATTSAQIIGRAKDGDSFELVSADLDWYQVKLASGSAGFIYSRYIKQ